MVAMNSHLSVFASEADLPDPVFAADIDIVDLDFPEYSESEPVDSNIIDDAPTSYSIDETGDVLDVSSQLSSRGVYLFENNPNASTSGTLTESNNMDAYFFSVTDSAKFLLAQLKSSNTNYVARLFVVDKEAGDATPTNIYGKPDDLIQLNGLPIGEYALIILSENSTYGQNYTLNIHAQNPAANISEVYYLFSDLSIFMFKTETGDVYSNGNLIYNTSTKAGNYLHWQRTDKVSWGSGYEQRTHMVLNATVKGMSKLASYSSKNASSNYVVLLYCDEDTEFSYVHTYYQSAPDHIYDSTTVDTTGRETPRKLDSVDFAGGNQHILVYDINTGRPIDFYSTLNLFYAGGAEPQPTINFY